MERKSMDAEYYHKVCNVCRKIDDCICESDFNKPYRDLIDALEMVLRSYDIAKYDREMIEKTILKHK